MVLRKREAFRKRFAGFDLRKVAAFGKADVKRLMADPSIIRARTKVEATIEGAKIWCAMEEGHEEARIQVRWTHDHLRLDAGGRHRQRS